MKRQLVFLYLWLIIGVGLEAQTKEELQNQKQKTFEEIRISRELMKQAREKKSVTLQRVRILQRAINSRADLIKAMEKEVDLLNREITEVEGQMRKLEDENQENREEYANLIYYAYRNHTAYEKLMYILASKSISQSYQRYKYLKYIGEYRVQLTEEMERMIVQLEEKREELNLLKDEKLAVMEEKENEQSELVKERAERNGMVRELSNEEKRLKEEIDTKERIARELEARIREIIEEEARRANADNIYGALTPEQELVGNDFRRNKGSLPWPVERGIVTTGFGDHEVPGLRGSSVRNNGIDISSEAGTIVRAIFEGEVTKVFGILGANYTVLIRHGEYLSVYQNLVNVRVKTGDRVTTKQIIGEAFTDEQEGIAMIHFEVWQERETMNPEEWLSK